MVHLIAAVQRSLSSEMLDFVLENVRMDWLVAAVVAVVVVLSVNKYSAGATNELRRDLHQRTIILAGLPSSVLTCTIPQLAECGATVIVLHPSPLSILPLINAIRIRTRNEDIYAEKCDLTDTDSVKTFSDNWNKSERTPTGPSNTLESGQIRRIDGVIFSTEYDGYVGARGHSEQEEEKRVAAAHLFLLSIMPSIAHSPNSRDIRVIRLVQPFYSAGTLKKVTHGRVSSVNRAGIKALKAHALTRYLQAEIDTAKAQNVVPEVDQTRQSRSNVHCLTVCPGFVRDSCVYPLFSQWGVLGVLMYYITLPIVSLMTKSAVEGSQVVMYALMKEKPGKGVLYRDNQIVGLPKALATELGNEELVKQPWDDAECIIKKV